MSKTAKPIKLPDLRKLRTGLRMNQSEFWARVGVCQSSGSRIEQGATPTQQTVLLLAIAYLPAKEAVNAIDFLQGR